MNIYTEMLNEIKEISIPEDIFENEKNFARYLENLTGLSNYLFQDEKLRQNFVNSILQFCRQGNDYILHKFKEYYAINRITNEFEPREIDPETKVFDNNQIYPLQKIKILIDWDY